MSKFSAFDVDEPSDTVRMSDIPSYIRILKEDMREITNLCVPIGMIIECPVGTVPDGFLECDGSSVTVAAYPSLFAVLGYNAGGSGANFNLPDARGAFPRMMDNGAGVSTDELITTSCQTTNGSPTITLNTLTVSMVPIGSVVSGGGIPVGSIVTDAHDLANNTITIDGNCTADSSDVSLTFTAHVCNTLLDTIKLHTHTIELGRDLDPLADDMMGSSYQSDHYIESDDGDYTTDDESRPLNMNTMFIIRVDEF